MTQEELEELVGQRIDDICGGGCVLPFGLSVIPGLSAAVAGALKKRRDFYNIPENRSLPH